MTMIASHPAFLLALSGFIVGAVSFLFSLYYLLKMIDAIKPERRVAENIFWPLLFLAPRLLTKKGEEHRRKFLLYVIFSGACFLPFILYIDAGRLW